MKKFMNDKHYFITNEEEVVTYLYNKLRNLMYDEDDLERYSDDAREIILADCEQIIEEAVDAYNNSDEDLIEFEVEPFLTNAIVVRVYIKVHGIICRESRMIRVIGVLLSDSDGVCKDISHSFE